MDNNFVQQWDPEPFIVKELPSVNQKFAIVILNRPILVERNLFLILWNAATVRMTVDGGTNHWYKFMNNTDVVNKSPDIVCGDFDSITEDTLFQIKKLGCRIIHTPSQDATDFTKALRILSPLTIEKDITSILVVAETSGRMDQIMANINTLHLTDKYFSHFIPVYIMASNSLNWLLQSGEHTIKIPQILLDVKLWCALIPIGQRSLVTTRGLKWNLNNEALEFGDIVSTSNTYDTTSNIVYIKTAKPILWSMGISSIGDD